VGRRRVILFNCFGEIASVPPNSDEKSNMIAQQLSFEQLAKRKKYNHHSGCTKPATRVRKYTSRHFPGRAATIQPTRNLHTHRQSDYSITPLLSSTLFCSTGLIILPSFPMAAALLLVLAGFSIPLKVLLNQPETRPGEFPAISV
jgi:hypothetical protein